MSLVNRAKYQGAILNKRVVSPSHKTYGVTKNNKVDGRKVIKVNPRKQRGVIIIGDNREEVLL